MIIYTDGQEIKTKFNNVYGYPKGTIFTVVGDVEDDQQVFAGIYDKDTNTTKFLKFNHCWITAVDMYLDTEGDESVGGE